jgi:hypothetical protein
MMFSQQPPQVPSRKQKLAWGKEKKLFEQYVLPQEEKKDGPRGTQPVRGMRGKV